MPDADATIDAALDPDAIPSTYAGEDEDDDPEDD
jgi:hypothetical protein